MKGNKMWFCQGCAVWMKWNSGFRFYTCPECGAEVWLPEMPVRDKK